MYQSAHLDTAKHLRSIFLREQLTSQNKRCELFLSNVQLWVFEGF